MSECKVIYKIINKQSLDLSQTMEEVIDGMVSVNQRGVIAVHNKKDCSVKYSSKDMTMKQLCDHVRNIWLCFDHPHNMTFSVLAVKEIHSSYMQ